MKLLNKNGFSMVQIMMAAGMMGVLSLGMMKMMETQKKSAKSITSGVEAQTFYNEFRAYLGKSSYCIANFKDEILNEGDQFDLEKIVKPNGKTLYKVGDSYGDRSFKLAKIEIVDFEKDSETSGIMKMQFVLDKIGKSYGARSYTKFIKIDVVLDEKSKLVSCATMGSMVSGFSGAEGLEGSERVDNVEEALKDIEAGKETESTKSVESTINKNKKLQEFQKSIDAVKHANKMIEEMMKD